MKITVRLSTQVMSRAVVLDGDRVVTPGEWSTVETVVEHVVDAAPDTILGREASGDVRRAAVEAHEGAMDAMRCAS